MMNVTTSSTKFDTHSMIGLSNQTTYTMRALYNQTTHQMIGLSNETTHPMIGLSNETTHPMIGLSNQTTHPMIGLSNETTHPMIGLSNETTYPMVSKHIIAAIHIFYIPFIVVPSVYVIAAVIFLKKLHTPHNVILLAVSSSDLLIALVSIPIIVLVEIEKGDMLLPNKHICLFVHMTTEFVENIGLVYLALLGMDTSAQLSFPLKYMKHVSIKRTIACIITLALIHFSIWGTFFVLRVSQTDFQCPNVFDQQNLPPVLVAYITNAMVSVGFHLLLCIIFGVYTRYKRWKLIKDDPNERTTMWLLMAFIIFYMPSAIMLFNVLHMDKSTRQVWLITTRLIRYLSSVTNGIFICYFRPAYRFAFHFFLRTNPIHWNRLDLSYKQEVYRRRRTYRRQTGKKSQQLMKTLINRNISLPEFQPPKKSVVGHTVKQESANGSLNNRSLEDNTNLGLRNSINHNVNKDNSDVSSKALSHLMISKSLED